MIEYIAAFIAIIAGLGPPILIVGRLNRLTPVRDLAEVLDQALAEPWAVRARAVGVERPPLSAPARP